MSDYERINFREGEGYEMMGPLKGIIPGTPQQGPTLEFKVASPELIEWLKAMIGPPIEVYPRVGICTTCNRVVCYVAEHVRPNDTMRSVDVVDKEAVPIRPFSKICKCGAEGGFRLMDRATGRWFKDLLKGER